MKKALIAMSGGVDSSVAAYLMKEQGYDIIGVTMKLYDKDDFFKTEEEPSSSSDDIEDAKKIALKFDFPYYVVNFKEDFKRQVIDRFIHAYEICETPNPCINCNRFLKFHKLYESARELGCEYIATGHYANIENKNGRFLLKRAKDPRKDQSYVLYSLTQEQLAHTIFPLGSLEKSQTRELAEKYELINAGKHDSQDICFIPDGDYASFIEKTTGKIYPEGDFVDTDGNVLGRHKGLIHYTIGQRRGLGLSLPAPLYVKEKNAKTNQVILCSNDELFQKEMDVTEINWIKTDCPSKSFRAQVKIRYSHKAAEALIKPDGERAHVIFDEPQRAITVGQAAVFYDGDYVLGGGKISC